jgi:hypothetical protein
MIRNRRSQFGVISDDRVARLPPILHEDAAMEPRSAEQSSGTGKPIEKSADEAREGVVGHNVRYVLAFGVAGAIIAFVIVYGYFFAH